MFESKKHKMMKKKKAYVEKMLSILETKINEASSVEGLRVVFESIAETIELAIIKEEKKSTICATIDLASSLSQ